MSHQNGDWRYVCCVQYCRKNKRKITNKENNIDEQSVEGRFLLSEQLCCLGILQLDLDTLNLLLMIFDYFVDADICHRCQEKASNVNNRLYQVIVFWKGNKYGSNYSASCPYGHQTF